MSDALDEALAATIGVTIHSIGEAVVRGILAAHDLALPTADFADPNEAISQLVDKHVDDLDPMNFYALAVRVEEAIQDPEITRDDFSKIVALAKQQKVVWDAHLTASQETTSGV